MLSSIVSPIKANENFNFSKLTYYKCRYEGGGKEEETMKSMKRVKMYFKKLVYSELIGMIRENIGKDVWNNNVYTRCCGVAADDDIDIDVVTAMIIAEASRQGHFDEFDYETKTEIVQFIMDTFKELMYKTFHEICMDYRDIDVKCDIYEFMKKKAAMMRMSYIHLDIYRDIDDMRYELIRYTEMRFEHDLIMDCHRKELLRNYIWDIAFSFFPMRKKAA